jgi:hypothetical protein
VLCAHQVEVFPENFEHRFMRREGDFRLLMIEPEFDVGFLFRSLCHETKLAKDGGKVKRAEEPGRCLRRPNRRLC